jgi:hypothetical protein
MNGNDYGSKGTGARQPEATAGQKSIERSLPGRYLHTAATIGAGMAKGALSYHELADLPFEYARRHVKPRGWARFALDSIEDQIPGMTIARPILKSKTYQRFQDYAKPENAFEYILNAGGEQVPDALLAPLTGGGAVLTKMAAKQIIKRLAKEALVSGVPSGLARLQSPENKLLDTAAQFTGSTMSKARAANKLLRRHGSGAVDFSGLGKDIAGDAAKKGVMYVGEQAARRLPAEQGQTPHGLVPGPAQPVHPATAIPDALISADRGRQTSISAPEYEVRTANAFRDSLRRVSLKPYEIENEIVNEQVRAVGGNMYEAIDRVKNAGGLPQLVEEFRQKAAEDFRKYGSELNRTAPARRTR